LSETGLPSINASSDTRRKDHELPAVLVRNGWRYHHLGIPTSTPRLGEKYLPAFRMYVSGFESNPFGIEWVRFEEGSPLPELVRTVPHVAFVVDDLERAIEGTEILSAINSPSDGVRVAMIVSDGAPVELMEFRARRE
jgi:hypothetical protein